VSLDARHEAAYPARFGAGLVVRLAGQATPWQVDVDTAAGDPECPLRPAAVHAKALRLLGSAGVAPAPAERLAAATLALADGGSLRAWTDCFAAVSEALEARDGTGAWWL
jgi:hypothetical protein